jgi:hypothetical protein
MLKWFVGAGAALIAWQVYKSRQTPFAGNVSTGWGGNYTGNLPSVINPMTIVGTLSNGAPIVTTGAPSQPFTQQGAGSL